MNEEIQNILIATPVRNRAWVLPYFITSILNLSYPKSNLGLLFIINNSTDDSENLINKMYNTYKNDYRSFDIVNKDYGNIAQDTRVGSRRHIYPVLADIRNLIKDYFLKSTYNYLFAIDSDIIPIKSILNELIGLRAMAAAAVIYNDKGRGIVTNTMEIQTIHPLVIKHINLSKVGNIYKADLSGAVALYKKALFQKGFMYKDSPQGEDLAFAQQLKEAKISWVCKRHLAYHIMVQENLDLYLKEGDKVFAY